MLGAVISAHFGSVLDSELGERPLGPAVGRTVEKAKEKPLAVPRTRDFGEGEATRVRTAASAASTSAFHLGVLIAGLLMIVGGLASGLGIQNPRRSRDVAVVPG